MTSKAVVTCGLVFCATLVRADDFYVSYEQSQKIVKFDSAGNVTPFANTGAGTSPNGLAFDAAGNLYVANLANNTVTRFNAQGQKSNFSTNGLNQPVAVICMWRTILGTPSRSLTPRAPTHHLPPPVRLRFRQASLRKPCSRFRP